MQEHPAIPSGDSVTDAEKPLYVVPLNTTPPDGGIMAWKVVFGSALAVFSSLSFVTSAGVFQEFYITHHLSEYSPSQVSWLGSVQTGLTYGAGLLVGRLQDAYGPRKILPVGSCLVVFGAMMASLSHKYYHFLLSQGVCIGIGTAFCQVAACASTNSWFVQRRGLASGLLGCGTGIGAVILPIMVEKLVPAVGFGWMMRIIAFLMMLLLCASNLLVRSFHAPTGWSKITLHDFLSPFRDPTWRWQCTSEVCTMCGIFVPINFIGMFATHQGMSSGNARYLITYLNAASIVGRGMAIVGDKIGRYNVISCVVTMLSILCFIPLAITNVAGIVVFTIFYGFFLGAYLAIYPACIGQISREEEFGHRMGVIMAFESMAVLSSLPIAGRLVQANDGAFVYLFIFSGVMILGGAGFYTYLRFRLAHFKLWRKV